MRSSTRVVLVLSLLATMLVGPSGLAGVGVAATTPDAPVTVELPRPGFGDLVLDEANDQLFVSAGPSGGATVVVDLTDNSTTTLIGVGNAEGMDLSPDGSTLWVTRPGTTEVRAVSTATLAVTDVIDLGFNCPSQVEAFDAFLVVAFGCFSSRTLAVVDLADDSVTFSSSTYHNLHVTRTGPDTIAAVETALSPAHVYTFDVGPDTVTETKHVAPSGLSDAADIVTNPVDGTVAIPAGSPNAVTVLDDVTLAKVRSHTTTDGTRSVAHDADGGVYAGTPFSSVFGFGRTFTNPSWRYTLPDRIHTVNGLTVDAAGEVAYVISYGEEDYDDYDLTIVPVGYETGTIQGDITHGFPDVNGGYAPSGLVELIDIATETSAGVTYADRNGHFEIEHVPAGTYYVLMWNGTETRVEDFFIEVYRDQPLFTPTPTVVTVPGNSTVTVNQELRPLFFDMFGDTFENEIYWMGNTGITKGCNPSQGNTLYCPGNSVTRGQMAAFLVRAFGLTDIDPTISFTDTGDSVFEQDILRLATAGITKGCKGGDAFCPDAPVTRGQMAAFMARAFGLPAGSATFADTHGSPFANDIARLADAGITRGCNPPQNTLFCPDRTVTRGQMAAFLFRGFTYAASTAAYDTAAFHAPATAPQRTATSGDRPDLGDR